jgi:L-lactate dehydrogenase complex protein LldE
LIDQFFPQVGESVVNVLRGLGVEIDFPQGQTCCGQPVFNSGFRRQARASAKRLINLFETSEYIVVPSGSCASMIKSFYPELFRDSPVMKERAEQMADRTYEFSQFLVEVMGVTDIGASYSGAVTYHASCHLLRELGVIEEPVTLLKGVKGVRYVPMDGLNECCGFGGAFSVKYPDISHAILKDKIRHIEATGADVVLSCDSGCLMQITGAMKRNKIKVRSMHLAELLDSKASHGR